MRGAGAVAAGHACEVDFEVVRAAGHGLFEDLRGLPEVVVAAQRRWAGVARRAVRAGAGPERLFALAQAVVARLVGAHPTHQQAPLPASRAQSWGWDGNPAALGVSASVHNSSAV